MGRHTKDTSNGPQSTGDQNWYCGNCEKTFTCDTDAFARHVENCLD